MFESEELKQHLETSSSINVQSLVIAEWNMNIADNISTIGNYRYRPTADVNSDDFVYSVIPAHFDDNDCMNEIKYWCGATYADVVVDGGLTDEESPSPIAFIQPNEKEKLLYSLEDCFKRFRPRSGINKLRYSEDGYTNFYSKDVFRRPRFYMASRNDIFKYWTSYREESQTVEGESATILRGIASKPINNLYYIDDAAPFIVYKNKIPANRVVVKMQTGVGNVDLGPFSDNGISIEDPFYGLENKAVPSNWKIQALKENSWVDLVSFNSFSSKSDGSPVIDTDGYVEIAYGLIVPEQYKSTIVLSGRYPIPELLPIDPPINSAFFVENENGTDTIYVWNGSVYQSFPAEYGWQLKEEENSFDLVENLVNPPSFVNSVGETSYKEFEYIRGLRIVVSTMNKQNSTFDLIELSPRLTVDLSDKVSSFSINKSASDLGISGMPVGQLLASNGSMQLFDYDDSFNKNNENSILSSFTNNNIQIKIFEQIFNFDNNESKKYMVPIKTMYVDGFPVGSNQNRSVDISLRDMLFYLESNNAPEILLESATLSQAASIILDNIGFTNYVFKTVEDEDDPAIPYFFVPPETSVAEVLQNLAIATQTAIFFDEYNNLVFMSRNYIMPSETDRATDTELIGSQDQDKNGVIENNSTNTKLANIIEMSSQNNDVFNDGIIKYNEKYIAKTYSSLSQYNYLNQNQSWIYRPVLLWEASGTAPIRSIGDDQQTSSYTLAAVALNSDLTDELPKVINGEIVNNIIDFGEGAYWVARYNGYFYANGEIVRYDAIEYNVSGIGNVWVNGLTEYQNYFSKVKFGGKIYPTGRVRIYAEPFYEKNGDVVVMKNGAVKEHGRTQFGTGIMTVTEGISELKPAYHNAGLSSYWSDTSNNSKVQGIEMDSKYLFSTFADKVLDGVYNQEDFNEKGLQVKIDVADPSQMKDVVYADSKWVGVGSDGQFRESTNGELWESTVDLDFGENYFFNSIAYGVKDEDGELVDTWIAVGYYLDEEENVLPLMAYASDTDSWTELDHGIEDIEALNKIVYADDMWLAVGDNGVIITSSDGNTWEQQDQKLDPLLGGASAKILSQTKIDAGIKFSLRLGSPGVFTVKSHGLREDDKIIFTSGNVSNTLPGGLVEGQEYAIRYKTKDTFSIKEVGESVPLNITTTAPGTHTYEKVAVTYVIKKHGLKDKEPIKIIQGNSGDLPDTISEDTIYYATVITSDTVHLSLSEDGSSPLELGISDVLQSGANHKVERFSQNNLFAAAYGNGLWAVGGQSGVYATSTDTITWTARTTGFGSSRIRDIVYADSKWMVAGNSGKVQRSTNGTSNWTVLKTNLRSDIETIAYGNGWLAGSKEGKVSFSSDLKKWKVYDAKFGNDSILKVVYGGEVGSKYWLAIGDKLKVSKSTDGKTWSNKSQENIGDLLFTTEIPHGFTPFDTITFTTSVPINIDGEKIRLAVISTSPAVFEARDENASSKAIKHKLQNNDKGLIFSSSGSEGVPGGLEEFDNLYIKKTTDFRFQLASSIDGPALSITNEGSGIIYFALNTLSFDSYDDRYFVTPKNITPTQFTVAQTRTEARQGITFKGKGSAYEEGDHEVKLYTKTEVESVTSISFAGGKTVINIPGAAKLAEGDRIFFAARETDGNKIFTERRISNGIIRYAPYYVSKMISETSFNISEKIGGADFVGDPSKVVPLEESGKTYEVVAILNLSEEVIKRNILSPKSVQFNVDNLLEITAGSGKFVSPTRVIATREANQIKKRVKINIANPAVLTCVQESNDNPISHGLFSNDIVTFTTTGSLPRGIAVNKNYIVNKINDTTFSLIDSSTGDPIETKDTTQESPNAPEIPIENEEDIQSGNHYFVKNINDINRIVLSKKVEEPIKQYSISTERVQVDDTDNEIQERVVYQPVSSSNRITATEEISFVKDSPASISNINKSIARSATRNGIVKNHFTKSSFSETDINKFLSTQSGTVQSSALIFDGPNFEFPFEDPETLEDKTVQPIDFVSYIYKNLEDRYSHFGTRMRLIGKMNPADGEQSLEKAISYFLNPKQAANKKSYISGASGGLGIFVNPNTNSGYYLELIAVSETDISSFSEDTNNIFNVVFYKTVKRVANEEQEPVQPEDKAIPLKLWQGITNVVADDGTFVGQFRMANETNPSVYDVAIEYEQVDQNLIRFYLMINNRVIAVVEDTDPLPVHNNMALFVRGGTRAMFENIYALSNNYSQNTVFELDPPVNSVFGTEKINVSESFRKYALSGTIQSSYLSGVSSGDANKYNIYYDEFGTIMRECAYFNIRYDKAYPALYAKISDTFTKMKGYTVSGFIPTAYGAEFLVFNNTDTAINLDSTSGNYLRIQGVTFTQELERELTVNEYFNEISNFSDPQRNEDNTIISPIKAQQEFLNIKNSRITNGRKEFSIESPYIQSQDEAKNLMGWIISKIMKPRRSIGLKVFANPTIQLGDIVSIDYNSTDNIQQIDNSNRFVVYNIEYARDGSGPSMTIYLSEVI